MENEFGIDDGALDEYIIEQEDEYIIEQEGPPLPNRNASRNSANKSRKGICQESDSNEQSRENKNKTSRSIKTEDKRTIMENKKSFVKAKANNSMIFANRNSENEDEFVCYSEINIIHEDSNGENEDPMESIADFNAFVDEVYVNYDQINLIEEDEKMVENYLSKDCCKRRCNLKFKADELLRYRIELQCLDYNENGVNQLDIVLLGLIHSLCRISNEIRHSRVVEMKNRRRIKMMFGFRGVSVCRAMFMFAHCIKIERLRRLIKHYKEHGISPRAHGNYKRVPNNAISVERMCEVVSFLKQYADENATVVRGRSANQNQDIKILPSHETKTRVFNKYKKACEEQNSTCISVVSFRRLWNRFCPNILIQRSNPVETKLPSSSVTEESSEETEEVVLT